MNIILYLDMSIYWIFLLFSKNFKVQHIIKINLNLKQKKPKNKYIYGKEKQKTIVRQTKK